MTHALLETGWRRQEPRNRYRSEPHVRRVPQGAPFFVLDVRPYAPDAEADTSVDLEGESKRAGRLTRGPCSCGPRRVSPRRSWSTFPPTSTEDCDVPSGCRGYPWRNGTIHVWCIPPRHRPPVTFAALVGCGVVPIARPRGRGGTGGIRRLGHSALTLKPDGTEVTAGLRSGAASRKRETRPRARRTLRVHESKARLRRRTTWQSAPRGKAARS